MRELDQVVAGELELIVCRGWLLVGMFMLRRAAAARASVRADKEVILRWYCGVGYRRVWVHNIHM